MLNIFFEICGYLAMILILVSCVVRSDSKKTNIIMRYLNLSGSAFFILYGFGIGAYATAFCNIGMFLVNLYYIIKLRKDLRRFCCSSRQAQNSDNTTE